MRSSIAVILSAVFLSKAAAAFWQPMPVRLVESSHLNAASNSAFAHPKTPQLPKIEVPHASNSAFAHPKTPQLPEMELPKPDLPDMELPKLEVPTLPKIDMNNVVIPHPKTTLEWGVEWKYGNPKEAIDSVLETSKGAFVAVKDVSRSPGAAPSLADYLKDGKFSADAFVDKFSHLPGLNFEAIKDMKMPVLDLKGVSLPKMSLAASGEKMPHFDNLAASVAFPTAKFAASFQALSALSAKEGWTVPQVVNALDLQELGGWYAGALGLFLIVSQNGSSASSNSTSGAVAEMGAVAAIPLIEGVPVVKQGSPLEVQVAQLSEATIALSKELKLLQSEKATRDYEVVNMKGVMRDLQNQLDGKKSVESDLKSSLGRAKTEKATMAAEIEKLTAEIEKLRSELKSTVAPSPAPKAKAAPVTAPAPSHAPKAKAAPVTAPAPSPAPKAKAVPEPVTGPAPSPAPNVKTAPVTVPAPKAKAAPVTAPAPSPAPKVETAPVTAPAPKAKAAPVTAPAPSPAPKAAPVSASTRAPAPATMFFSSTIAEPVTSVEPPVVKAAAKTGAKKVTKGSPKTTGVKAVEPKAVESKEAKVVAPKATGSAGDLSALSTTSLKRKTVKDLSDYLTSKGISITDANGKTLKKADLLQAVQSM